MGKGAKTSAAADFYKRAMALAGAGDLTAARAAVDKALRQAPRDAGALALKGALLTELGEPESALALFERALAVAPNNAATHSNKGNALAKLERREEAVESFTRALALNPDYAAALTNRAGQRFELKQYDAALEDAMRAVALSPNLTAAHRNQSRILLALDRPQEALASLDAAGAADAESLAHRGAILTALGRHAESLEAYDRAVAGSPGDPENLYRRAHARLRVGDFEGGWRDHEARWGAKTFLQASAGMAAPLRARFNLDLSLADLTGKSVLVVGEQGVGDQVMFASMLPDLAAVAGSVSCVCDGRLTGLLARSFPEITFTIPSAAPEGFDHILPLGSLGRLFRPAAESFPGLPYLRPRDTAAAAWRRRLGPKAAALRVGVSWRGGVEATGAAARSMALETLRPLLERGDCEFVSLQYGPAADELAAVNATLPRPIRSFPAETLNDFEQLAGLIQAVDVVVSVQNTTVHLSGALGKTCLALIPVAPEWRSGAPGEAMPWYRSVRLLRQTRRGDWASVVAALGPHLDALAPIETAVAEAVDLARATRIDEAVALLEGLGPAIETHVRASGLMGTLMTMAGRSEAALPWFERSLALDPLQPAVHTDLGNALTKLDRPRAATDAFDRALRLEPAYLPALNNRAGQRLELKDGQGALEDADKALALNPKLGSAHRFRARALLMLDRTDEGLKSLEAAEAIQPDNPDNPSIRAAVETAQGRFADAAASLDRAVALEPENANYLQARAYARLRLQDFAGGWADHEHRWRAPGFRINSRGPVSLDLIPRLDVGVSRDDLVGKRVLVVGEQGVGDQIMFASMLPDLARDAAAVTCVTSPRMQSLFEASFPGVDNRAEVDGLRAGDFDKVLAIASLGPVYRGAEANFPGRPYLRARDEIIAGWREKLGEKTTRLRVGVSWRGGADITRASARSTTLEALRPLLERADCEFVNLQYGKSQAEVDAFNETLPRPIRNFPREEIENFEALAGLVANLDLVVSVQTTIIHLSGAIGAPCLVMLPFIPEWRYGAVGETMPWYGGVRLLRQPARGAWAPVIAAVSAALDRFDPGGSTVLEPDLGPLVERALTLARGGDLAAAIAALQVGGRAVLAHARAAGLLAGLFLREGRHEESLPYFEALNRLEPDNAAGHVDYGKALAKLDCPEAAAEAFGRALALQPDDAAARVQRGSLLVDLKDYEAALTNLDAALSLPAPTPLRVAAHQLRARARLGLKRFEEALPETDAAIALDPDNPRSHYLRARGLVALGRIDEARLALERTVAIDPNADAPRYMLSMLQLRRRDFASGWLNYERRWRVSWFLTDSNAMVPAAIAPRLVLDNQPDDFNGKTVLVIAEQGVGDQIMFSSILPDLVARASKVTFVSAPKPMALFKASFPTVDFIPPLPSLRIGAFDKVIALGSLPRAFRNRLEDFPGAPYLRPRDEVIEAWKARLGPKTTRLRVGLSWQGGTDKTSGQKRSIELEQLRPLLERDDCEFVSLQYGDVEAEVAAFNATLARPIRIFPKDEIDDFEPLAGLVLNLDLVVSVQTAIIHLSGALGAPCLVMIPHVAEWRYGTDGETMPWYNSVRLIRQSKVDDWTTVVETVGAELDARAER
jgi:tetratricopeptide (TPR) repeat protein